MTYKRIPNNLTGLILLGLSSLIVLGGLIILPYVVNYYFSPDQLVKSITQSIESLTGTRIRIGESKLSLIDGVTFSNVKVLVPPEKLKTTPELTAEDALLLRASTFHIKLRRSGFLGLKFRLGMITVDNPEFHFTHVPARNIWNWQALFNKSTSKPGEQKHLNISPPIVLNNGKIVLSRIDGGSRISLGEFFFSAQATPQNHKEFYRINLKTWTPQAAGPTIELDVAQKNFEVLTGSMQAIPLNDLQANLPEIAKNWSKQLHLSGKISVSEFAYKHQGSPRIVLMLDGVKAKVPLTQNELESPSEIAFFNLSDLTGKVVLDNGKIIIPELAGRLNGSKCKINGELRSGLNKTQTPDFTLAIACEGFDCPKYTDPAEQKYIETNIPWKLRCFFHDFKPIGRLNFKLVVDSRPDKQPAFTISGLIVPLGLSAEYFKFPYRVDQITGSVKITNGRFELINLDGKTGPGKVLVNGTVSEASKYAEINLDITSRQTPLCPKLLAALPDRYKAIFIQFNPMGFADTRIRLYQPYGLNQPWKTDIVAQLSETSATYKAFPYKIHNVSGTLDLKNNLLELKNISGRHGKANFTLAGSVEQINTRAPSVKLDIFAQQVPIDADLVKVLPQSTQRMVRDCSLTGNADIRGTIVKPSGKAVDYRFDCDITQGKACYKDFPYPLENFSGQFTITPTNVQVNKFDYIKESQRISAQGSVSLGRIPAEVSLKIEAENIPADGTLRNALATDRQKLWDEFSPSGLINAKVDLIRQKNQPWDWQVVVDLEKNSVNYKQIEPVTELTGQVTIKPGRTMLNQITGLCEGKYPLGFDATIENTPQKTTVIFDNFQAQKIAVSESFLSAIGKDASEFFKCKPGGAINCSLSNVKIELAQEKLRSWEVLGKLSFEQVRMELFNAKAPTNLEYIGHVSQSTDGKFAIDGSLNVETLNWNNRKIENLRTHLAKKINDPIMIVDPLRAEYANGEIYGLAKVQFIGRKSTYGLQLTLDNIDAASALDLDMSKHIINGKMSGEIFLLGTFGNKADQVGGGMLQVCGAEVLKVPMMAQIYRSVSKEPPNLASFHDITAQFSLEKYMLKIQHVELVGPSFSLIGQGQINISNDRIILDLVSGTPKRLRNLPVLPELMQGAAQEISEIEIRGTTQKPTISARPLKNISETLKTFFDGKAVR
jgi:hypothetical protein